METKIYKKEQINEAAAQLKAGQLVAFPTETVFGLGAIATNEAAVSSVFATKGRPQDNPLIVHVSSIEQVAEYVAEVPEIAAQLMMQFWPGPLTIIFPQKPGVLAPSVTPGQETVAIRMPDNPETLALIEATGIPLVGPSANKSGKPSPTAVEHVYHDFQGKIAGIVEPSEKLLAVGVESTVVLPRAGFINILRPGAITKEDLRALGYQVEEKTAEEQLKDTSVLSPGVKYTHYSPKQPVHVLITDDSQQFTQYIDALKQPVAILADESVLQALSNDSQIVATHSYGAKGDLVSATQQLYAGLRALEQTTAQVIIAQGFPDSPASHAMMNRLRKAADLTQTFL